MTLGNIHSIESFGAVDGPGVRYVIFLKGCNMRCAFCHNPDTRCFDKNNLMSADDLLKKAIKYKPYRKNNGGITVSGGEPLLQIDFVIELFKKAKELGISTCLDTSAEPFNTSTDFLNKFDELIKYTDLVLFDIKHIDDKEHIKLTLKSNKNILACAKYLSDHGVKLWVRYVLVPTINTQEHYLKDLRNFIDTLTTIERVEVLPYHTFGVYKYKELGLKYRLEGINEPSEHEIELARAILKAN